MPLVFLHIQSSQFPQPTYLYIVQYHVQSVSKRLKGAGPSLTCTHWQRVSHYEHSLAAFLSHYSFNFIRASSLKQNSAVYINRCKHYRSAGTTFVRILDGLVFTSQHQPWLFENAFHSLRFSFIMVFIRYDIRSLRTPFISKTQSSLQS